MTEQPSQRFPLAWPMGWRRTPPQRRQRAAFSTRRRQFGNSAGQEIVPRSSRALTVAEAIARLTGELDRLTATSEVLSSNVAIRLDGLPRSGQPEPDDPGAAVYFRLTGKPRCLACDRWDRVADNIAAIAQHIDALRRIDRYGVGTMEQAFAGYAALPPSTQDWWLILGVPKTATLAHVEEAFKALARKHHPDLPGGSHDMMTRLTEARVIARQVLTP